MKYTLFGHIYRLIVKPIYFLFDPEWIHDMHVKFGHILGKHRIFTSVTRFMFSYNNPSLTQDIMGIRFSNPIGLSAGFDKDGYLTEILGSVGFGFMQVGSVTQYSYAGNPKPRLTRYPEQKSIVVNYGLKNDGAAVVLDRLTKAKKSLPISISIAKTNSEENASDGEAIQDYVDTLEQFSTAGIGDFYTLNISCPNTYGGEPFTTSDRLIKLLAAVTRVTTNKPMFVKMPINLSWQDFESLLEVIIQFDLEGVVIGNLNKDRSSFTVNESIKGNLSGLPTQELSNVLISETYKKYRDSLTIIGVGGVFSAQDAYEKIKSGATLVQLITGMIYEGPQLIGQINNDLVPLLKNDGFTHISEAIGAYHKI